jgi:hypothetical protein
MCRKLPPTSLPDATSEDDGRDQKLPDGRVGVDLVPEQLDQHGRSLRMADEHDRATVVEMGEVVLPGGEQARIGELLVPVVGEALLLKTGNGHLVVHGSPYPAHLREALGLGDGSVHFGALDGEVGVERGLGAHRRVDVEAVDGR